jgi:hypothetical protein
MKRIVATGVVALAAAVVFLVVLRVSARQPTRLFELRTSGGWVAYHQTYELYDSDELVMRRTRSGRDGERRVILPPAEAGELYLLVLEANFADFDSDSPDGQLVRQASRIHDMPQWRLTVDDPGGAVVFSAPMSTVGRMVPELATVPQVAAVWELSRRLHEHWEEVFE